jgi:hypothetical protein
MNQDAAMLSPETFAELFEWDAPLVLKRRPDAAKRAAAVLAVPAFRESARDLFIAAALARFTVA